MPRAAKKAQFQGEKARFVELRPNDIQKAELTDLARRSDDLMSLIDEAIDNGFKISIRHDEYSGGVCAWALPPTADKDKEGLILSGRARTVWGALATLMYTHAVAFRETWPVPHDHEDFSFFDDIR